MEKRRFTRYLILPALLLLLAAISPPQGGIHAGPPQQEGNLLQNPGFEQPFVNGTAEGWKAWSLQTEKQSDDCADAYYYLPKWNMETGGEFVAGGVTSQYIGNNWDTWSAGVMQTVDATPGNTYRFTFASKGRTTNERSPEPSDFGINMNIRAGIDPNGSGVWNDADVVWGAAGSPHDAWQTFTVEVQATGDKITVFTSANLGVQGVNQCRQFLDTWYDNAELVAVTQAPPPAPTQPPAPAATQPPAPTPTAIPEPTEEPEPTAETPEEEPEQEPEPTPVPEEEEEPAPEGGGTICVNAFHDENANGLLEDTEGFMAGVTIVIAGESEVIGQAISDGSETPTCFQGLAQGPYQVAQQPPGRLEMTTAGNALVAVTEDHTVFVTFGSRVRQEGAGAAGSEGSAEAGQGETPEEATPDEASDEAPDGGFDPLALSGLGIILLGVVLLGGLLFYLLRR